MVLLEAMASKKPVIATRIGAIPHVIKQDDSGMLVDPRNIGQLKHAILELLQSEEKSTRLGKGGYERITNHFSSDGMAGKYMGIYRDLVVR